MSKLSKILSSFFYLICIVLILSYAGLVYVNNSNDTIEPENISRPLVAQDSQKAKGEGQEVKKEYWDNGKLKRETHRKDGELGLKTIWYESGQKEVEIQFKNGKENGLRKEWDEDGKIIYEGNFVDGVLEKNN